MTLNTNRESEEEESKEEEEKMGSPPHIVLFPFMSKGHTIPLVHLSHLLFKRGLVLTIFTTPANSPFIRRSLGPTEATVIDLPFPENIAGIPPGVESTDQLPSMSLLLPFFRATELLQPHFEQAIQSLPRVNCMVSDAFLWWTQETATTLNVPRLVFYGMSNYAMTISRVIATDRPHSDVKSNDEAFSLQPFNWISYTKNDLEPPFDDPDPKGPMFDFVVQTAIATLRSRGIIVNSFYELEPIFADYWNKQFGPKAWSVGPLCLAEPAKGDAHEKCEWQKWLDEGTEPVLYIAFGTQAELSAEQVREIGIGLEKSEVCFLWAMRSKEGGLENGFEERVARGGKGLVVKEWVDQRQILGHERVRGFLSHCGWNSAIESICAGVPILAWPLMAEQGLNAKMVVEELGIGLRIGGGRGFGLVGSKKIEEMVRDLMMGEKGKVLKDKAKELGEAARSAMEEGGSSWLTLDSLIQEVCTCRMRENVENDVAPLGDDKINWEVRENGENGTVSHVEDPIGR